MEAFRARIGTSRMDQKKPKVLLEWMEDGAILKQFVMKMDVAVKLANDIIALDLASKKEKVLSVSDGYPK